MTLSFSAPYSRYFSVCDNISPALHRWFDHNHIEACLRNHFHTKLAVRHGDNHTFVYTLQAKGQLDVMRSARLISFIRRTGQSESLPLADNRFVANATVTPCALQSLRQQSWFNVLHLACQQVYGVHQIAVIEQGNVVSVQLHAADMASLKRVMQSFAN